jgi:hypothetical protein
MATPLESCKGLILFGLAISRGEDVFAPAEASVGIHSLSMHNWLISLKSLSLNSIQVNSSRYPVN